MVHFTWFSWFRRCNRNNKEWSDIKLSLRTKTVQVGRQQRESFARIDNILSMPNLLEIQLKSYEWLKNEGLGEVLRDVSPIKDYQGKLIVDFIDYSIDEKTKYDIEECKLRGVNYAAPFRVRVRLTDTETGEIKEQDIFMGDFPLMTESGTFVINGAERVVVSQLVRSPGMYYDHTVEKTGKVFYTSTIIPYRGAWLEYEIDSNDIFSVHIDKNRKMPVTLLIRALDENISDDAAILSMFGNETKLQVTLDKDGMLAVARQNGTTVYEEALKDIFRKLRPGEPANVESAKQLLTNLLFDNRRYDLGNVGRYKFDKKVALARRIAGKTLKYDVASPVTGELLFEAGTTLTLEDAQLIEDQAVNEVIVEYSEYENNGLSEEALVTKECKVFSNNMFDPGKIFPDITLDDIGCKEKIRFVQFMEIYSECGGDREKVIAECKARISELSPHHITKDDIYASINYILCLSHDIGTFDDIDHLGNRRIRCVGELIQNQMRIGFSRMDKAIRERMATLEPDKVTPQSLINIRPVAAAIREFFGSSPLSQFMDQNNPLAELTHKRRLSALGPGGLSRDRASFEVRDVHYTHYGRICPIETPEGPNIGLISYLASYAKINDYGFIEAPYRKIDKTTHKITDEVMYMTADVEDDYIVAQANEPIDSEGHFVNSKVLARNRQEIVEVDATEPDFIDVSPQMVISVATGSIPFLENDDNARALMGSNMQKQAVPLLVTESPIVATGMEYHAGIDSGVCVVSKEDGVVEYVDADRVVVRKEDGSKHTYNLLKFKRSNQGTCVNQIPIVNAGDPIKKGDVIADGPATYEGEISLGKNALIGFMSWEGYNYEDAVLLNERLVREDVYTSIHIEEYVIESRQTKLGNEEITREIPNVGEDAKKNLDVDGIVRVGTEVKAGDILVGKVTPKGDTGLTPEEKLLHAIFGEKAKDVRDTSLRLRHGESGIVIDIHKFTKKNGDDLSPGVIESIKIYVAQKRKISVGDKMAGRHGNKGVVSRILPSEDMPFLEDGTPLDIVLNPLGVPSRMNIGQVLEVHLGIAAKVLGIKVMTPAFDGAKEADITQALKDAGLREDGKRILYDGRTGEPFDNPVTVGIMYYLKLHHLVDDKIHARSTGPYSLVTQQPLGGKAQFGGQRFGEMEVWALEAYGAAYTLQEILTVKSDDVTGRVKTYEAIVKGQDIPTPGVPESFKVLIKELQSLALDVKVLDKNGEEIVMADYDDDAISISKKVYVKDDDEDAIDENDYDASHGFTITDGIPDNDDLDDNDDFSPDMMNDEFEFDDDTTYGDSEYEENFENFDDYSSDDND